MFDELVRELHHQARIHHKKIATAESCTGGGLAYNITKKSGASEIFERGFVTYSNQAKHEILQVPQDTLEKYGAVSAQTATAMVTGLFKQAPTNCAISITGIAGPNSDNTQKKIGTIHIAYANTKTQIKQQELKLEGSRTEIQQETIKQALKILIRLCQNKA